MRIAIGLVLLVSGCQTYELTPTSVHAVSQTTIREEVMSRRLPAELLLMIDRSGSMLEPIDASLPGCTRDGVACGFGSWACDPSTCPTRWSELRTALAMSLPSLVQRARVGAVLFPKPGAVVCEGPAFESGFVAPPASDDLATMAEAVEQILAAVDASPPGGGTPTGAALGLAGQYFATAEPDRDRAVALLTDGLPNCNEENSADADVPGSGCECTVSSCVSNGTVVNPLHRAGCLDEAATVEAIATLRDQSVFTYVVGFGAELTSLRAIDVLNAMATAGGRSRWCWSDVDCGDGDSCSNQLCGRRFLPASDLQTLLAVIGDLMLNPCKFHLQDAPADPSLMTVSVDGQLYAPGEDTWRLELVPPQVVFTGELCQTLMDATARTPRQVEIKVVEAL